MRKNCILFFVPLLLTHLVCAQQPADTLRHLQDVPVLAIKAKQFFTGSKMHGFDTLARVNAQAQNLGELLGQNSGMFIRNYGPGSLALASFRGSNGYHTPVLWNGINLQSPMNSLVDFSLFPVFFTDDVQLQYGGSGSLFGTGAIGGVVHLNDKMLFETGFQTDLLSAYSSMNNFQQALRVNYGGSRFFISTRAWSNNADNRYTFLYQNKHQEQPDAGLQAKGFQQHASFLIKRKSSITFHTWYQQNVRNIPPANGVSNAHALQHDETLRSMLEFQHNPSPHHAVVFRAAWFRENLEYRDDYVKGQQYLAHTIYLQAENVFALPKSSAKIHAGLNHSYAIASGLNYVGHTIEQNRFSAFAFYKNSWFKSNVKTVAGLRQEWLDGAAIPIMPSFGFEWSIRKSWTLSGNISRAYRIPTFNDLYWSQSGNPKLKPEQGWGEELSIQYEQKGKLTRIQGNAALFNRNLNDFIQWLPATTAYWSPFNTSKVWCRGFESAFSLNTGFHKFHVTLANMSAYVLATIDDETHVNSGKRVLYSPRWKHVVTFSAAWGNYFLRYNHTYTGTLFTSSDNSSWIAPSETANLQMGFSLNFKKQRYSLLAAVHNLWNTDYMVVLNRPMPLRHYQITIQIHI